MQQSDRERNRAQIAYLAKGAWQTMGARELSSLRYVLSLFATLEFTVHEGINKVNLLLVMLIIVLKLGLYSG